MKSPTMKYSHPEIPTPVHTPISSLLLKLYCAKWVSMGTKGLFLRCCIAYKNMICCTKSMQSQQNIE